MHPMHPMGPRTGTPGIGTARPRSRGSSGGVGAKISWPSCGQARKGAAGEMSHETRMEPGADPGSLPAAGPPETGVTREVEEAVLDSGDGVVCGSCRVPPRGRIRVYRSAEGEPDAATELEIPLDAPGAFADRHVENGRAYRYRFVIESEGPGGRPLQSAGVTLVARPDSLPHPIEELLLIHVGDLDGVASGGAVLELHFAEPVKGTGRVYRCASAPPWTADSIVRTAALSRLGPPLPLSAPTIAFDPAPPAGSCFYVPVTILGERAALGTPRRYVAIEEVSGLEVQDLDSHALLRWRWPAACNQVLLAWRTDGFPTSAHDPKATRRRVTRAEYDRQGGFHFERKSPAPHHFVAFASTQLGGEESFASGRPGGCRAMLRSQSGVLVSYSVTRRLLRRGRLRLVLRSDTAIEHLPELVVVAKPGELQPIHSADGHVLLTISGARLAPDAPLERDVELHAVRPPVYLRAFFAKPQAPGRLRLVDPPREQLKVK